MDQRKQNKDMPLAKEKLNDLVRQYQSDKLDATFTEIYLIISERWSGKTEITANTLMVDELDLLASYDDTIMKAIDTYDASSGDFENYFTFLLKNRRHDLYRRARTIRKHEVKPPIIKDESDATTFDRVYAEQGEVINGSLTELIEQKKETDQRQLIDSLLDPDKVIDSQTTTIVYEVLNDDTLGKFRPTTIAKKLNVHHSVVSRKLHRLRKNYDSSRFGDYRDYLCV